MIEITIPANTHAAFLTVSRDVINEHNTALAALRDDYTAQGEALSGANACVMELESQLAEANMLVAALKNALRDMEQSRAIERRNVMLLNDQLSAARSENSDLHAALSGEVNRLHAFEMLLADPASVHLNILRGVIPLSRMNALHIACATDYDTVKAENARLRALALNVVEMYRVEAMKVINDGSGNTLVQRNYLAQEIAVMKNEIGAQSL